jgi:hypothetical protein
MVKFSFFWNMLALKMTNMLSQTISDEPTCAVGGGEKSV